MVCWLYFFWIFGRNVFFVIDDWAIQFALNEIIDWRKIICCLIMLEEPKRVTTKKTIFLIFNGKNIALVETKTKFKVWKKRLLLHLKYYCNNINLKILFFAWKKLLDHLWPLKIECKSKKWYRFTNSKWLL